MIKKNSTYLKAWYAVILICSNYIISNACTCDTTSFNQAIASADEIFIGHIVKADRFRNGTFVNAEGKEETNWEWRYQFDIEKKWKGNHKSTLVIYHHGSSCDYWFDIYDERYLVYASNGADKEAPLSETTWHNAGNNKLTTWLCSRTVNDKISDGWYEMDLARLNREFPDPVRLSKFDFNPLFFIVVIVAILILTRIFIHLRLNKR